MFMRFFRKYRRFFDVVVLAMSTAIVLNQLIFLTGLSDLSPNYQEALEIMESMEPWMLFVLAVFAAPIYEELIFRGLFYGLPLFLIGRFAAPRMRAAFVPVFALVSALLFAAYHGNLVQFIYAFIMALFMCLTYECCGGILWSILFHMCANFSVLASGSFREEPDSLMTLGCMAVFLINGTISFKSMLKYRLEYQPGKTKHAKEKEDGKEFKE